MRPFLKWAGGKTRIVTRISAVLPGGKRLVEPFAGSAALMLNTDYPAYVLADANTDLINCYRHLQCGGPAFVDQCRAFFAPETNRPEAYYALRERFNGTQDLAERAALFVYLNRHGYNGLCRYNASGGFNVPFGRYARPYFPEAEMRAFWQRAQRCEFAVADFVTTMESSVAGDVVYCDPPYVPLSATANFTSYSADTFGLAEQQRLAHMAQTLAQSGIPVAISNHDTPVTRNLYAAADKHTYFDVQRHISCDGTNRAKASEVLVLFSARDAYAAPAAPPTAS